jgi:hypothetical protein
MKYLILTALLVLSSCGRTKPNQKLDVSTSTTQAQEANDQVAIPLSLLSKKLILNIAYQGLDKNEALKGHSEEYLQAKIVYLKIKNNALYIFEDSKYYSSSDLASDKLLYTFKITHQNTDKIFIDFAEGFKSIDSTLGDGSRKNIEVILQSNYLKDFQFLKEKIALTTSSTLLSVNNTLSHLDIHFTLQELTTNKNFSPIIYNKKEKSYFFTTQPVRVENQKELVQYITKHDISKPIVYNLSSRIPKEYRTAIIEGILYWNKALGKKIIATTDESSQQIGQNRIEWINDEEAHSCYGLSEINPLSGEITGSTIYLRSGFFTSTKEQIKIENIYKINHDNESLVSDQLNARLRSTVAHEVGHTLGLRHNFMGNTQENIEQLIPSSSVMDYLSPELDIRMGEKIIEQNKYSGKYDQEIMQKLYGENTNIKIESAFCTDEDVDLLLHCRRNDTFTNELQEAFYEIALDKQPAYFVSRHIDDSPSSIVENSIESDKIINRFKRLFDSIDLEKKMIIEGINTDEEKFHYVQKGFELAGGEKAFFQLFINDKGFFNNQRLAWEETFQRMTALLPEKNLTSPNWLEVEATVKEELLSLLAKYNASYFLSRYNSEESRKSFEYFCAQIAEEIIIKNPSRYTFSMKRNATQLFNLKSDLSPEKYPVWRFFNDEGYHKIEQHLTSEIKKIEDKNLQDINSRIYKKELKILFKDLTGDDYITK